MLKPICDFVKQNKNMCSFWFCFHLTWKKFLYLFTSCYSLKILLFFETFFSQFAFIKNVIQLLSLRFTTLHQIHHVFSIFALWLTTASLGLTSFYFVFMFTFVSFAFTFELKKRNLENFALSITFFLVFISY